MKKVLVETSARHVHVTNEHLEILFGKGYELHHKKDLSQPGQFASEERVAVVGSKNRFDGVMILGPTRPATQVELSATDARAIGVKAPIRESGDIEGSAPVKLIGPAGEVDITQGCIIAKRHIHLDLETAKEFGLENGQIIKLALGGEERKLIFGDVVARVNKNFATAVHLDTDESNAANGPIEGEVVVK